MSGEGEVILIACYGVFWLLKNFLTVGPNGTCSVFEIDGLRFSLVVPFLNVFHLWPVFPVGDVRFKIGKKVNTDTCFFVDYNFLPTKPLTNGDFFRCLAWAYLNWLTLGFSSCFQSREDGAQVMKRVSVWEEDALDIAQARREAISQLRQELEKRAANGTKSSAVVVVTEGLDEGSFLEHEVANIKALLLKRRAPTTTERTESGLSAPLLDASPATIVNYHDASTNHSSRTEEGEEMVAVMVPRSSESADPAPAQELQSDMRMKNASGVAPPPTPVGAVVASAPPPTQSLLFSDI